MNSGYRVAKHNCVYTDVTGKRKRQCNPDIDD
ncbi:MAG: hypothetical protein KatS3mg031_2571 [Chitinophagales bacterium]|nr:MAG: hypothetical protein KatS3mg031_2571 [Chitinophagales bacterium]